MIKIKNKSSMEKELEKTTDNMGYEDKMLFAFVGKPEKFEWYKKAFSKYNVYGVKEFKWVWSWYAFFFGFLYLLYRKVYKESLILGGFYLVFGSIGGFLGLIINIVLGGTLPYFIYERYLNKKREIEQNITDENLRIEAMSVVGGVNTFVRNLCIIFAFIILLFLYLIFFNFI